MLNIIKLDCESKLSCLPDISEIQSKKEGVCPVDWALNVVKTARANSCGKTVMCRDGLWQIETIISDLVSGGGESDDTELLRELLGVIDTVGCVLAKKAAELVLASMDAYADEWDAHIRRKRCSELVCASYYSVYCDPAACTGCGKCIAAAPEGAIAGGDGLISVVRDDSALKTAEFLAVCPSGALKKAGAIKPKLPQEPVAVGSFGDGAAAAGGRRRRRG